MADDGVSVQEIIGGVSVSLVGKDSGPKTAGLSLPTEPGTEPVVREETVDPHLMEILAERRQYE